MVIARDLYKDLDYCNRRTRGQKGTKIEPLSIFEFDLYAQIGWPEAIKRALKAEEKNREYESKLTK